MQYETLEELVAQRKGYKFLQADGTSPYQSFQYDLKSKRQLIVGCLNEDVSDACGMGWNLATLKWIADNCMKLDGVIVECTIPPKAKIIVPEESDGKFRTDIIKFKKVHTIESLFPALKDINDRLKNYNPVNPITAEEMPDTGRLKKIMNQVGHQVGDHVRNQVGHQVGDHVRNQVRHPVGDHVRNQVGDHVRNQVWDRVGNRVWDQAVDQVVDQVWNQVGDQQVMDQVWDQVGHPVGDHVRNQVWDQVVVIAYHAVKEFFNLDYNHPAFELIGLGVIVVRVLNKFMVFGKNGKYLGEFK